MSAAGALLVTGCGDARSDSATAALPAGDFLLTGGRIFDGEQLIDADSVLVTDGVIAAVGRDLAADGAPVYDAGGATLLPGLIDAHVHAYPGALWDAPRFGVTTVLDMGNDPDWVAEQRPARADTGPTDLADLWSAGLLVTAPGGHGVAPDSPTLAEGDDAAAFVADRIAEGADYIKIVMEDGSAFPGIAYVSLTADQLHAVVAAAHDHDLLAVVHVGSRAAAIAAVDAGADVLTHTPADGPLTAAQVARVRESGIPIIATLAASTASACGPEAEQLATDPRVAPRLSGDQRRSLDRSFPMCFPEVRDHALANAAALHQAGVPLLAGSDAPNPGTAFGLTLLSELALLVEVGLTPMEALTAATAAPADLFALPDRGRIIPGARADLLLVDGDPTTDIDAVFDLIAVWRNGHPIDRSP